MFFITASLHASGNIAYVLLGTSREQQWSTAASDVDVDAPSINHDTDENAPLVADSAESGRTYGAVSNTVS